MDTPSDGAGLRRGALQISRKAKTSTGWQVVCSDLSHKLRETEIDSKKASSTVFSGLLYIKNQQTVHSSLF